MCIPRQYLHHHHSVFPIVFTYTRIHVFPMGYQVSSLGAQVKFYSVLLYYSTCDNAYKCGMSFMYILD